jgi:tRNA (guanine37-N1)-methyltransferase
MRIDVVTLFPELVVALTRAGITGRACRQGLLELVLWNPRDYTRDPHRTVDDRPYGGGPGMLMKVAPLRAAIRAARQQAGGRFRTLLLSPQGRTLDHQGVVELAREPGLLLVAGRYEGIDERIVELEIDEEWSIGDFVLSGGELAAMVLIDAVTRQLPGALGHDASAAQDSFAEGLLDCPHYTRPEQIEGLRVPAVLLSGNHQQIRRWREQQALGRTWERRPDLLRGLTLTGEQQSLLKEYIGENTDRDRAGGDETGTVIGSKS